MIKLVLNSSDGLLDKKFIRHLVNYLPTLVIQDKEINRKLSVFDVYLQKNIFTTKRIFTAKQILLTGLRNLKVTTDNSKATISFDTVAQIPFYDYRLVDILNLIDSGNLEIKGTNVVSSLFRYIKANINSLRKQYEMGIF